MTRRERAIAWMEEARQIHEWWAAHLRENPRDPDAKTVGPRTWHERWIRNYTTVITLLQEAH